MIVGRMFVPSLEMSNAMNAIADKSCTRNTMAAFYADLIACASIHGHKCIDWKAINDAITKRWPKGLNYIKKMAWRVNKA